MVRISCLALLGLLSLVACRAQNNPSPTQTSQARDGSAASEPTPQTPEPPAPNEGIPTEIGTKVFPEGLLETADWKSVQEHRIHALEDSVGAVTARWQAGLENVRVLLDAQTELALVKKEVAESRQERLDALAEALSSSLLVWQQVKAMQEVGANGGDAASEAQARAVVFRHRAMWLKERARVDNPPSP